MTPPPPRLLAVDEAASLTLAWQSVAAAILGTSDSATKTPGLPNHRVLHTGYFRLGSGSQAGI